MSIYHFLLFGWNCITTQWNWDIFINYHYDIYNKSNDVYNTFNQAYTTEAI